MPAKRSLRLEVEEESNHGKSPRKTKRQMNQFSPTTGTCQLSPSSVSKKMKVVSKQVTDNTGLSNKESRMSSRGQPTQERNEELLDLIAKVQKSLGTFLKMRQSLKHLESLEGSRELENILGVRNISRNLNAELQKTKALVYEAKTMEILK
ncbi:centromere protein R [Bombina bombina]|uniref:centromere protein R n=1 Tax=Bombina bombina TaxID=8345 RepID=UPI00235A4B90|nr:centromere protein R [Bombina bombina]